MKKNLLGIALAVASTPFAFAGPQANTPAATNNNPAPAPASTTQKHAKKTHKVKKAKAAPAATPDAKPAK